MTGCRWRLLAVFSLLCFAMALAVPVLGQDTAGNRLPTLAPPLAPNWAPLRYHPSIAPVWIPPPNLPRSSPVASGANVFKQLVGAAGIIFSGRVTFIGHPTSSSR